MPGPIKHFQLRMNNTSGSKAFYENVFGWSINLSGTAGCWEIKDSTGSVIGELQEAGPRTSAAIIPFFEVGSLANAITAVNNNDGLVLSQGNNTPVLNHGHAFIKDYEGCVLAIFQ